MIYLSSVQEGQTAENLFIETLKKHNWELVSNSTENENTCSHFDFTVKFNNKTYKVDVKDHKRLSRRSERLRDMYWIEWKNIFGGPGWIKGKSDYIAFKYFNQFKLYNRHELLGFCLRKTDFSKIVTDINEALYCIYTRKKDQISLIKISDLETEVKPIILEI
ncbi:MAG: hypothetical protein M0R17_02840 [Candidatus Omnitrophica bacterium]|jgi:hypothetical protein|nr:hypothetical protein [Candidatus Omnitrophota bacterium]